MRTGWWGDICESKYWIVAWCLVNLADWASSLSLIIEEANPIMRVMSPPTFLVYKIVMPVIIVAILIPLRKLHLVKWLVLGIAIVVIWNVAVSWYYK